MYLIGKRVRKGLVHKYGKVYIYLYLDALKNNGTRLECKCVMNSILCNTEFGGENNGY